MMKNNIVLFFFASIGYSQLSFSEEVKYMSIEKITIDKEHGYPMVSAEVAGAKTKLRLDTTSSHPLLLEAFAQNIGIYQVDNPLSLEDIVPLASQTIPFRLGPVEMLLGRTAVIKKIQNNDQHRIGMVFNPHSIECQHCLIVMDFINGELYVIQADSDEAAKAAVDRRYPNLTYASAPYAGDGSDALYVSGVSINQGKQGVAAVVTGHDYSLFLRSSVKTDIKIVKKSFVNVKDKNVETEVSAPVPISFNGQTIAKIPILLEAAPSFASHLITLNNPEYVQHQGNIGMDILKNCALALETRKAVHLYCKPSL
ncbi:MAG: hypothetical protein JO171_14440 [Paludibacterium sp.]|uniref:hypothetical protein n=1 Tax=Paludibacterium sp. TaxID=1917523 RepID=UPI0025DB42E2|nr:hypothetical protein [Paludibacterium sp.]MBV8048351.1 hypothetical protein [Paludibacterium sp.]MBV8469530.1 hypothetical protein [Burkholderiaceae bacterium]MBV8647093.1 hypothetical protein [Paludibacterium sp.]